MDNMHTKIMPSVEPIQAAVANLHTNEVPFIVLELFGTWDVIQLEAR